MFPPFPEEKASKILEQLAVLLTEEKITLKQVTKPSEERKNQGVMIGALVCLNSNGEEVALITNSGISKELTVSDEGARDFFAGNFTIVPPVVSSAQIEEALSQNDLQIHQLTDEIKAANSASRASETNVESDENISQKSALLKKLCSQSLEKVHALYSFACIDGTHKNLKEICRDYNASKLPPTGTGDCCAPKLLHYAFSHNLQPVSMAETLWQSKSGSAGSPEVPERTDVSGGMSEQRREIEHDNESARGHSDGEAGPASTNIKIKLAPPCDSRCGILLPAMLGLRILYRDDHIIVVNKQSGLLSVPGRGPDKQDCIVNRLRRLFPDCLEQPSVHRLDMETSGLLVLAFTKEAHRELNRQFENREVHKEYEALLDGVLAKKGIAPEGQMELFFRLDVDNRPHQIWDAQNGKSAVTQWQILNVERYHAPDGETKSVTRVRFIPHTGRTHQLRLASADSHGFGIPIIGDTLYGNCQPGERLMLHAKKIHFRHPITGAEMDFTCEPEF